MLSQSVEKRREITINAYYILALLQKPQNRQYSALGPLYLKTKVSKTGNSLFYNRPFHVKI